ncbi:MAG: prepilin-type N-terminal cleavage/methylation domain-containing protein [Candidatus Omnitrophica bacterium]|nr:prepilin-type N-terminal cleavage/methylation domain-containing protein [Candidatus Omnitrophota bacterium]MDD5611242.1 prepilin-type N-terminal cleavage/methylation domain-containing protein [Candidatus Omnitrophota bacterium]
MFKDRSRKKNDPAGFSLLELIIVIVVVIVLAVAGVFIPLHSNRLIAASNKLMFDLRYAQQLAISRQVPCGISFSTNNYFIFINTTSTKAIDPYTGENYTIDFDNIGELKGVSIASTNFGGLISFNYMGVPYDSVNSSLSDDGIVTLHYGPQAKSVSIEPNTGQVKIQ